MCDAQGKQCRSLGEGTGEGIMDADFVFYVSVCRITVLLTNGSLIIIL